MIDHHRAFFPSGKGVAKTHSSPPRPTRDKANLCIEARRTDPPAPEGLLESPLRGRPRQTRRPRGKSPSAAAPRSGAFAPARVAARSTRTRGGACNVSMLVFAHGPSVDLMMNVQLSRAVFNLTPVARRPTVTTTNTGDERHPSERHNQSKSARFQFYCEDSCCCCCSNQRMSKKGGRL